MTQTTDQNVNHIPLRKLLFHSIEGSKTLIDSATQEDLIAILKDAHSIAIKSLDYEVPKFDSSDIDKEVEWIWQTKRGTLPKRLANWFYKTYKLNLPEVSKAMIGAACGEKIAMPDDYAFDITDRLQWRNGDFGDQRSCFLDSNHDESARLNDMMDDGRFRAIRFFRKFPKTLYPSDHISVTRPNVSYTVDDSVYLGTSRAWIFQHDSAEHKDHFDASLPFTVFNGYGYTTSAIANFIAGYTNNECTRVSIDNPALFINDGGYLIGDPENTPHYNPEYNKIDFCRGHDYDDDVFDDDDD